MIKVLIIDDEENVRDAVKILGQWERLGISKPLEACDGRGGLAILMEQKPDIVLLDMRMPEMNGIEFLQSCAQSGIDTVNIVISGYDDFEFTQQAIRSQVFDYLLKPISGSQLNATLERACALVRKRRERQSELLERSMERNMSLNTLKEKVFLSVIEGTFNNRINASYLRMVGVNNASIFYGVAILHILNQEEVCTAQFEGDADIFRFALLNIADEILGASLLHFCCKNTLAPNEFLVVVQGDSKTAPALPEQTRQALTRLIHKLGELLGVAAAGGVGTVQEGLPSISISYHAAREALLGINLLSPQRPVALSDGRRATAWGESILSKMALIRNALENGDENYADAILDEYLRRAGQSGSFTLREAAKTLNEYLFLLGNIALDLDSAGGNSEDAASCLRAAGIGLDYASFEQFCRLLHRVTHAYCEQIQRCSSVCRRFDAKDVKEYIDKNYFQEIKLSMFTEKYYLSKAYIMKLFKQDYGMSIYEYVQKVRMEKAKQLLGDPKINIQNISQMVGYNNNNYFSKAFKTYFHIAPSVYRMQMLNGQ